MTTRFPITSECPGCQARADGKILFEIVEQIAIKDGFAPDRFQAAMCEATAIFATIFAEATAGRKFTPADTEQLAQSLGRQLATSILGWGERSEPHRH